MLMSKDEVKQASRVWAANVKAPLTRDEQILMMTTAGERHAAAKERILQLLKENKMS
jgi:hypothetical protein